jgi:nucleoid DNA-binding protein
MAHLLNAINKYRARINVNQTISMRPLVEYLHQNTGVKKGQITMILNELPDAVKHFNLQGKAVKLSGLGSYFPKINLKGKLSISHRIDKKLSDSLPHINEFRGEIKNKDNIGKTLTDFIEMWDKEHPDNNIYHTLNLF